MVVRADSPFKTFNDLLNYARKNPGQLKWSLPGRGVTLHMTPMLIFKKEGVTTIDVPYKGGAGRSRHSPDGRARGYVQRYVRGFD